MSSNDDRNEKTEARDGRDRMNRLQAVWRLHAQHPDVIEAPGDSDIDLEALQLEVFWFQSHVCALLDDREESELRSSFATVHQLLLEGDRDVRDAIAHHFAIPELICHPDLAWAQERMPPLLSELVAGVKRAHEKFFEKHRE